MTVTTRIRNFARDVKYRARKTRGRAKQRAGKATGNERLRRQGKAEVRRGRLAQLAQRVRDAIGR
jgi:uncharacterized protein YjbJ (UPF0337 family)